MFGCKLLGPGGFKGGRTDLKFLGFAQSHPIYSGGSTGLTDFFGAIVSPSISQRNCCCVRERTSSGLHGHWNRLFESLLYNRSQPSPSHTSYPDVLVIPIEKSPKRIPRYQ